jgi:hypothetical protein
MNTRAMTLVGCAMIWLAPDDAAARLHCTPAAVKACEAQAVKLCRDLPRERRAKCLDDLTDDCTTPESLCKSSDLSDIFKPRRPRTITTEDPMVITPDR